MQGDLDSLETLSSIHGVSNGDANEVGHLEESHKDISPEISCMCNQSGAGPDKLYVMLWLSHLWCIDFLQHDVMVLTNLDATVPMHSRLLPPTNTPFCAVIANLKQL